MGKIKNEALEEQQKALVLEGIWDTLKETIQPRQIHPSEYVRKEKFLAFMGGVMDMKAYEEKKNAIEMLDGLVTVGTWEIDGKEYRYTNAEEYYNLHLLYKLTETKNVKGE